MVDIKMLQANSLFGGLTDEEAEKIHSLLEEEHYPKGADIIREGETNDRLFFLAKGSVNILKKSARDDDEGEVIAHLSQGDAFGEMELIDIQPSVATVRAAEDVEALTLSHQDLYTLYQWNVKTFAIIVMNMAREISRRLRKMDAVVAASPSLT